MIVVGLLLVWSSVSLGWLVVTEARDARTADARCRLFTCELTIARMKARP